MKDYITLITVFIGSLIIGISIIISSQVWLLSSRSCISMLACKTKEFAHHRDESFAQVRTSGCTDVACMFRRGGVRHVE